MAEDEKKFSILTMPIVKEDFYSFLLKYVQSELSHMKITLVEGKIYEAKGKEKGKEGKGNDSTEANIENSDNAKASSRKGKSRFNKGKFSTKRKGF